MIDARCRLEINTEKLVKNYKKMVARAGAVKTIPIIKANAYGFGMLSVYRILRDAGAELFGVATIAEAVELAAAGGRSLVLGGLLDFEIPDAVRCDIICTAADYEAAKKISDEATKQNRVAEVHIPVDTGMGRVGMQAASADDEIARMLTLPNLKFTGIFSHLSCAANPQDGYSAAQIVRFTELVARLKARGITFPMIHIGASDSFANFDAAFQSPFTMARIGLSMYGFNSNYAKRDLQLEPVAELKSHLMAVRMVPAGVSIGYSRLFTLPKPTLVGTVAAGYADGIPLALTNRGFMLIGGKLCPVLGRVAMDYLMVSLDAVPDAKPGDEVVCFGHQGEYYIPLNSWAQIKGTHEHELLCSIGSRVCRVFV